MRGILATLIVLSVLYASGGVGARTTATAPTWLATDVHSATLVDKTAAYVGDGDNLSTTSLFGSGMSSIVMLRDDDNQTRTYFAGEVSASQSGGLLVVECEFKNTSDAPQTMRPLDVSVSGVPAELVAAGVDSSYPFAKDAKIWAKLRKKLAWTINKGQSRTVTYVFGLGRAPAVIELRYHGARIAEVNPTKS